MIRCLLALKIILFLGWLPAFAEPILVRSGEHRDFTRVVLPLPQGATYQLSTAPGLSAVIFDGFSDGFDLSEAFEIIPRTRLSALVGQASRLELQLACDCTVAAFVERNRYLVLDIFDGPPLPDTPVATAATTLSSELPQSGFGFGELLWRRGDRAPEENAQDADTESASEAAEKAERQAAETDFVLQSQTELLEAFSRAASRGLLDPKQPIRSLPPALEDDDTAPEIFDSSLLPEASPTGPQSNIRITDSRDRPDASTGEELTLAAAICPDPEVVAINTWGSDEEFHVQIGPSNSSVFDELGRTSPKQIVDRARLYVFFGFGAEALETLELIPGLAHTQPELVDLAHILEFGYARNPRSLHRFADCNSDLALWGILAARQLPPEVPIDATAALLALQKLPGHLKLVVAQNLAERLLERGDAQNARIAMRSYERLEENDPEQAKIVDAREAQSRGAPEETEIILGEIIAGNTVEVPEAVSDLVASLIEQGKPVPADIALLAEAQAFEQRNGENGPIAYRTFVTAAAGSGQFDKAFQALEQKPEDQSDANWNALVTDIFAMLTEEADDAVFVQRYFEDYSSLAASVASEEKIRLALRLSDLGFIEQAESIARTLPEESRSENHTLLNAQLLLASGRHQEAFDEVARTEGARAAKLRALALEAMGRNAAAATAYAEADMAEHARSTLLLSDAWAELVPSDEPVFGALRSLADAQVAEIEPSEEMLDVTQDAIAESVTTRSVLDTTLSVLRVSD